MVEKVIHTEIIKSKFLNEQLNVNKHRASLPQRKKMFILHDIFYLIDKFSLNRIYLSCLLQKAQT